ncbi:polyA polymerase, putative [Entamoeba invadens IP1]|uniref:polynucleotide adenylyltransferase n=1 Tax=Entamoeba invadens IP1 TaxID=370355 RepID=A0A0A1U3Y4_ENTIV|nr:polyA polymerase, putative [Entamoeba invadens IP1]ELP87403.1 polyA polymerase, putative [Entamoeba invadens IP1]|eukprot:XP_004254174.1 polyA polymerase, putative [Entamoeba invadens IP1]
MTDELRGYLEKNGMYPTPEEKKEREKAISYLNEVVEKWGKKIYISKTGTSENTDVCAAKIFTYGSYRLDVYGNNADIDACVVTNSTIEREDFFNDLYEDLKNNPDVREIRQIKSVRAPILTMTYMKIDIDLNFARTAHTTLPKEMDILSERILDEMDELSTRAINGRRNTDMINNFVPPHSVEAFKVIVRAIKMWSKKRGIYGYVYSYLNGISIEILVAQVISENYQLDNVRLLEKFFHAYATWDWARNPVMLGVSDDRPERKKEEMVQVITPAAPRENSMYNMTRSSLELLKREMLRGERIVKGYKSEGGNDWNLLFKKRHCFCGYYIFVEFSVRGSLESLENKIGMFESKIVRFVRSLEEMEEVIEVNVIPEGYLEVENAVDYYYVGMNVKKDLLVDVSAPLNAFLEDVNKGKEFVVDALIKKRSEISVKCTHKALSKTERVELQKVVEERKVKLQEMSKEQIDIITKDKEEVVGDGKKV